MDALENLFPTDNEHLEKLRGYAMKLDYKKIFFEHLGPELKKIFINEKEDIIYKNFLEGLQYEYGFFNKKIDLQKAFSLYKKYADLNDYFCMYKMHVIYLCEYEKFNVPFNRILEKLYLIKCLAYVPNYVLDLDIKLFGKIDIIYELALILDLEDNPIVKHETFFDLLNCQREKYNLTENDIILMKGCLFCYFNENEDDSEFNIELFSTLNSIIPNEELDYAYYYAKNKCIFFKDYLNLNDLISDSEIKNFYNEVKEKKLYEFYNDFGNYLLDKNIHLNTEIFEILTISLNKGDLFSNNKVYQCLIDFYDFEDIMSDYNKASNLLNHLLKNIVFEKLSLSQFLLLMGYLIKHSKFPEKIISNYLVYVKEINEYINSILGKKEKEKETLLEEGEYEFFLFMKAYIYYFGFQGIEKQNLQKAIEYLDKGINITEKNWVKKFNIFMKYNIKKLMNSLNLISNDELIGEKKDLILFFSENLNLKYEIIDCYILGKDYFEGITRKKDEFIALSIYKLSQNIFCDHIVSCIVKSEIKKFLNHHEIKTEKKLKDETCCICYDKKINKILIPCKHYFCSSCAEKLEKDSKCPICRGEILGFI